VEVFKEFYDNKNKHRKLTWIYSLGSCHINARFDQKPIELVVTTYQVPVLNLTFFKDSGWMICISYCYYWIEMFDSDYLIPVYLLQACLLMLFNTSDKLGYPEIMTQSNLSDDDLPRLLHSLSCGKYKILSKEPNTKTVTQNDSFEFNRKFNDRMRRIKVKPPYCQNYILIFYF